MNQLLKVQHGDLKKQLQQWTYILYQTPLALGVLLLGLVLTGIIWRYNSLKFEQETQGQFEQQISKAKEEIHNRLQAYTDTFHAARGFWVANDLNVDYKKWKIFVESLNLQKRYPGINGIGFIRFVNKNKEEYEKWVSQNNQKIEPIYENYLVKPPGDRPNYFVIEYCEPIQKNRKAIGLDVGHESIRRKAAERARDTGKAAATGRIILVQDSEKKPGLLIYLPVYRPGMPTTTIEERRQSFFGFIYAPFRVIDLTEEALSNLVKQDFDLSIYNGKDLIYGKEASLQDARVKLAKYRQVSSLDVAGETWTLYFTSRASLNSGAGKNLPTLILSIGTFSSLLLFGIIWFLAVSRSQALRMATQIGLLLEEQKATETDLKEALKAADAANQAKSEFLANMSHELRTPLNGILGYAQILQRSPSLSLSDVQGIGIIYQCGSHLLTLINDILDLSKIEARKLELHPNPFHFPFFLQGVVEICGIRAQQKGLDFFCQTSSKLPNGIFADEKRLRQVLINLIGNAIKFTETGRVAFRVAVIDKSPTEEIDVFNNAQPREMTEISNSPTPIPSWKIRFQVEDTGIGMSAEQMEKIFLPFEQVGDRKKQSEGTGLGLAISQQIVEMMGSKIQVGSKLGHGSVFWLDLDLPEALEFALTSTAIARKKIIGFKGSQPKILIVDDRADNRSVIVNLLEPIGFQVAEASNGEEGLEKVVQFQPDLIITDFVMPVMDGFEMLRRLRQIPEFKNTIVIVSSASAFDSDRRNSLNAGSNDFLPKPVQAEDLLEKLRNFLALEWIYEEKGENSVLPAPESLPSVIVPPPSEEIETLFDLAMKGNLKAIQRKAQLLEKMDQKFVPFSEELQRLVRGFQEKEIVDFIGHYRI